jgi:flagellar protein FliO/FliZ
VPSVGLFLNFVWALLLVLALAYAALRLLGRAGLLRKSPAKFMEQVDYLPLGPKRGIALVQVVDRTLALGISEAGIQVLGEVSAEALRERAESLTDSGGFGEELLRLLRRPGGDGRP